MKTFFSEFRTFVLRGNVLDLAVGVMIGAGFQSIVTSLTNDILSPIIGLFVGRNFDELELQLGGAVIRYGAFLTVTLNFLIMAFVVFLLVRTLNKLFAKDAPEAQPGS